jgi:hypothetical protein
MGLVKTLHIGYIIRYLILQSNSWVRKRRQYCSFDTAVQHGQHAHHSHQRNSSDIFVSPKGRYELPALLPHCIQWEFALEDATAYSSRFMGHTIFEVPMFPRFCLLIRPFSTVYSVDPSSNSSPGYVYSDWIDFVFLSRYSGWLRSEADELGFNSRQGQNIFLFYTASKLTLSPTQPLIQRVPGGTFSRRDWSWPFTSIQCTA